MHFSSKLRSVIVVIVCVYFVVVVSPSCARSSSVPFPYQREMSPQNHFYEVELDLARVIVFHVSIYSNDLFGTVIL